MSPKESRKMGKAPPYEITPRILALVRQIDERPLIASSVFHLLAALQDRPQTAMELMAEMEFSHRYAFRTRYFRPALDLGLVEMTRSESPTAKNQQYRLTERGRASISEVLR